MRWTYSFLAHLWCRHEGGGHPPAFCFSFQRCTVRRPRPHHDVFLHIRRFPGAMRYPCRRHAVLNMIEYSVMHSLYVQAIMTLKGMRKVDQQMILDSLGMDRTSATTRSEATGISGLTPPPVASPPQGTARLAANMPKFETNTR